MNKYTPLIGILAVALTGCDIHDFDRGTKVSEDFHHVYKLKAGGRLSLESFNGSVEVYGWDKEDVEINGAKYARSKDALDSIRINITPTDNSLTIRADAPHDFQGGNRGVRFVLHVPRHTIIDRLESSNGGIRVEDVDGNAKLRTSNGAIRVRMFKGNLDGETSNGSVTLEEFSGAATLISSNGGIHVSGVKGHLDARTSNAAIDAVVSDLDSSDPIKLRTSNGAIRLTVATTKLPDISATTSNSSITLRIPPSANARIKARTSNSSVRTDLGLNNVTTTKTSLDGTLNAGGPIVDLTTSNGSVHIEKN